jgi:hypothetical protein
MKFKNTAAAASLLIASIGAMAAPVQLTQSQFATAATAPGFVTRVENFSSFTPMTNLGNSIALNNGTFTGIDTAVSTLNDFCGGNPCLTSAGVTDLRTFSLFPAGTQLWGALVDMVFDFQLTDPIHIEVVGQSGTLALDVVGPMDQFLGFSDSLGLISVSFENQATGNKSNYSFDNVTTAGPRRVNEVPEPASLGLVFAALVAAVAVRRSKSKPR